MKVAEAIAKTLIDEGVEVVFSLLGDANLDITYYLHELGVTVYEGRHEASVFAMADGYSRATGKVVACGVTAGPALAHVFTPLVSAVRNGSKVVLFSGERKRDDLLERQWLDHQGLVKQSGAGFKPIYSGHTAVDRTREVVDFVRSQGIPCVLDVPADVQATEFEWDFVPRERPGWTRPWRPEPDPAAVDAAVELMLGSERPVVLAGGGAVASDAREELLALGEELGSLMAVALNARGYFHGDTYDAGVAGLYARDRAMELFHEADLVISFGASMNRYTTESGYLFPDAQFIQSDIKTPRPMLSGDPAELYLMGDARAVARALREALARHEKKTRYRTEEVAQLLQEPADTWEPEGGPEPHTVDPRKVCAVLDEILPDDVGWVSGNSGHFWSFPIFHMPRWRQPMMFGTYFGAVGYGLPVGLGATLGNEGRPVLCIEGDAGAMMYINTLETAARYNAKMLLVILNDGALGAEYHKMVTKGFKPDLSFTPDADFEGLAERFGARGRTLTNLDDLPGMVQEFLDGEGPMVINAKTSTRVVSQQGRRVWYGLDR